MRISDWSSDVCSSDLLLVAQQFGNGDCLEFYNFDSNGLRGDLVASDCSGTVPYTSTQVSDVFWQTIKTLKFCTWTDIIARVCAFSTVVQRFLGERRVGRHWCLGLERHANAGDWLCSLTRRGGGS